MCGCKTTKSKKQNFKGVAMHDGSVAKLCSEILSQINNGITESGKLGYKGPLKASMAGPSVVTRKGYWFECICVLSFTSLLATPHPTAGRPTHKTHKKAIWAPAATN